MLLIPHSELKTQFLKAWCESLAAVQTAVERASSHGHELSDLHLSVCVCE